MLRIYVDTSVIGGCFDDEFSEWSNRLIEEAISGVNTIVLSDLTLEELENAPEKVRKILENIPEVSKELVALSGEEIALSEYYIKEGVVSEKCLVDARHIAIATVNRVDILVSWNFKHIVNYNRIRLYNAVNMKYGYPILEIRSPREVLHEK